MNALDQAFIKAFAKDRSPAATAKRRMTELRAQPQPPAEGVESVSLVLHHLYQQGKRLRIDRPTSDNIGLDAHMIVPLVEHVESYDPGDVLHATQPPVVFEDRLTPLDPVVPVLPQPPELDGPDVAQRRADSEQPVALRESSDTESSVTESSVTESSVTESSVNRCTDAIVDKDVPTLDLPAAKLQDRTAQQQESAEDQLLAQCLPQVLVAATQLAAPQLMTLELGQLDQVATPSLEIATSAIEIALPQVDLDALEASARHLPPREVTRYDATTAVAVEPNAAVHQPVVDADPTIDRQQCAVPDVVPEAVVPEAVVPEVVIPEVVIPEVVVPEVVVPEVVVPEAVVPEAVVPEAVVPEAVVPEAVVPAAEPEPIHAPQPTPSAVEPSAVEQFAADPFAAEPIVCSFTAELPAVEPVFDDDRGGAGNEVPQATSMVAEPAVAIEPAVADSPAPEPAPTVPFTPAWEVDAFRWPALCQQLDDQTEGRLTESGAELYVATQDGLKILAVTSSHRLEGRTTLALALARTAAVAGSRVALVDADSANPELARRLGMEAPCDWREVVRRGEPLSEAAVASLDDGVTLFPRTFPTDDEVDFSDESLLSTLSELGRSFDLVVVDLPPAGPSTTASAHNLPPCPVDMAVVVRNVQTTSQEQCLATVASLRQQGVRAVGVIENFTQTEDHA